MAGYVPYYSKKRERREYLESVLLRILGTDAAPKRVLRAAEAVRQAKMRELASRRAELPPKQELATELAAIDRQMGTWSTIPLEAIVDSYRRRTGCQ